jgi:hypothetical protein
MKWNIINSIDIAKIYPETNSKIIVSEDFNLKQEILKFFDSFHIPYTLKQAKQISNSKIYFGFNTDFKCIYIISGILKSYGLNEIIYKPGLKNKISLGSTNRKYINEEEVTIQIEEILELEFYTSFHDFISLFIPQHYKRDKKKIEPEDHYLELDNKMEKNNNSVQLINSIALDEIDQNEVIFPFEKFYLQDDKSNEVDHDDDLEEDKNHTSYIDPYENYRWGGLSGEEAYIGYWNTE